MHLVTDDDDKNKKREAQEEVKTETDSKMTSPFDLDKELYRFNKKEPFTIRQACEGVQIFGGVGAGKTSGSGAALAQSYLKSGFGGLVLCAKQTVLEDWLHYAKIAGREEDIIVMDASGKHCFPFMQYEVEREGEGAGLTENIIRIFTAVFNAINQTDSSKSTDQYWVRSMQQLLRNCVDLSLIARNEVSIPLIQEIIASAAQDRKEAKTKEWLGWQDSNLRMTRSKPVALPLGDIPAY